MAGCCFLPRPYADLVKNVGVFSRRCPMTTWRRVYGSTRWREEKARLEPRHAFPTERQVFPQLRTGTSRIGEIVPPISFFFHFLQARVESQVSKGTAKVD